MKQYVLEFTILTGPNTGQTMNFEGGMKGDGVALTTKAMKLCGWDSSKNPTGQVFANKVLVVVDENTYTSKKDGKEKRYGVIKYVNALDGSDRASFQRPKFEGQALKDADDEFMAIVQAQAENNGETQAGTDAPAGSGEAQPDGAGGGSAEDDDIPF